MVALWHWVTTHITKLQAVNGCDAQKIALFGGCLRGGSPTTAADLPNLWPGQRWLPDGSDAWVARGHRAGREATHHGADHETSASNRFRRPDTAGHFGNWIVFFWCQGSHTMAGPWREGEREREPGREREREREGEGEINIVINMVWVAVGCCQLTIHCQKREANLRSLSTTRRLGFGPQGWSGWWCRCFRGG